MNRLLLFFLSIMASAGCGSDDTNMTTAPQLVEESMYYPDNGSNIWETTSADALGWNENQVQPLLDFLEDKHTRSFLILVNGKIAMESYFNNHTAASPWYWASAGKTLTATVTGIAEQQGYLKINDRVSDYLETGWTNAPASEEGLITNRDLLTMTSGLNETLGDGVSPENLQYTADAGTRWAYHNVYVKLQDVVASATGLSWSDYFNSALRNRIGMTGTWIPGGDDLSVYWSNSRSMARFGLLMLNKGKWKQEQILNQSYFSAMTTPSQDINKAYGYLWWLNGKESFHLPQSQLQFSGSLIPSAPEDMYMALGKNDQKIYVIPGRKMVVIRMGDAADQSNFALSGFDDQLWQKINAVIGN